MARPIDETTLQQRLEIGTQAKGGASDRESATAMGLSRWTVRKWRRRYQKTGRAGLASVMGRPTTGALGSIAPALREAIHEMRRTHTGWGPQSILTELAKAPEWAGQPLPGRSRIAAYLRQADLTRPYAHHTELLPPVIETPAAVHAIWELDAQGVVQVTGLGAVSVINIVDPISRVRVESYPCVHSRKPATADYQLACRRAFLTYGRPQVLSLDHDSVFYDNACASPFPSRFHLWLIGLDVQVEFIAQPPPAAHACIERMHTLMYQQAVAGQTFPDAGACQQTLDARRDFLNQDYPSRSLGGQPPLVANPTARHSGRGYDPYQEAQLWDSQRVTAYLARHHWFRTVSAQGQFSLGAQTYGLGPEWANQSIEVTFAADTSSFCCRSADGQRTVQVVARGLSAAELMGELPPWTQLPAYQRRLALSPETRREAELYQALTGTT